MATCQNQLLPIFCLIDKYKLPSWRRKKTQIWKEKMIKEIVFLMIINPMGPNSCLIRSLYPFVNNHKINV